MRKYSLLDTLPTALYTFLGKISIFKDGWTAEVASAIFSAPCAPLWCEELLRLNLISKKGQGETARYSMEAALQRHLKKAFGEQQWEVWQNSFTNYFLTLSRQAAPHLQYAPDLKWMECLNAEAENLYAVIDLCRGEEAVELVCNLWLWGLERGEFARMHNAVGMTLFDTSSLPVAQLIERDRALGVLNGRMSERDLGIAYLHRGLEMAEENGLTQHIPFFLNHLGVLLRQVERVKESEANFLRGFSIWREQGNRPGQAMILNNLGILYWSQDRLAEARTILSQSVQICCELQIDINAAKTLNNLASVAFSLKNYEEAIQGFSKALFFYKKLKSPLQEMEVLNNIAVVWLNCGEITEARKSFIRALKLARQHGFETNYYCIIAGLAQSEDLTGNQSQAVKLYSASETLRAKFKYAPDVQIVQQIEQDIATLRSRYVSEEYDRLYKQGKRMSLNQILAGYPAEMDAI